MRRSGVRISLAAPIANMCTDPPLHGGLCCGCLFAIAIKIRSLQLAIAKLSLACAADDIVVRLVHALLGCVNTNHIDDQREVDKRFEHDIELFEAREDAVIAFEAAEQPFDFIAPLVQVSVIGPRVETVRLGRDYGLETKLQNELPGFIAFVGAVHDHRHSGRFVRPLCQQFAPLAGVVRLPGRQAGSQSRSVIRGNHMNFGGKAAAGSADRLRSVFFNAPVPSG